jgi:hypothetical protein
LLFQQYQSLGKSSIARLQIFAATRADKIFALAATLDQP